jgi:hypothetical protein
MHLKKTFSKHADRRGRLTYRRCVRLPIPISVRRASLVLDDARGGQHLVFSIVLDGDEAVRVEGPDDRPFTSELNLRVSRGERELLIRAEGLEPGQLVAGTIEVEYALF